MWPVLFTYRAEIRVGGEIQTGRFYDEERTEFSNAFYQNVVRGLNYDSPKKTKHFTLPFVFVACKS